MNHVSDTERDLLVTEILTIHDMLRQLHQPREDDDDFPCIKDATGCPVDKRFRGRRMTLAIARKHVHHAQVRLKLLAKSLDTETRVTPGESTP